METETPDENKPMGEEKEKEKEKEETKEVSRESEEKKEVEENEEEEEKEDNEENREKGAKKGEDSSRKRSSRKPNRGSAEKKEPMTPSSDRPTRERKVVERYSVPSVARSSTPKPLSIEKGAGTQLKDIPNVAFKLSKRKYDDNLQLLHMILFGKKAKPQRLKRNIGQFSGYVWVENEQEKQKAKVKEKIDKCVKEKLVDFCDLLNIPIMRTTVRKEELSAKLLEFLESPCATTDILLAEKEQKGKKRKATPSKNIASGETSEKSAKKRQSTPQGGEKRKRSSKVEEKDEDVESPVSEDDSHEDDVDTTVKEESDDEETNSKEEEDAPKKSSNKSTSKKIAMDRPDSKLKETSASGKKLTSAKSSRKSSVSTSKQGASDGDRTPGSKLKGSASKKQKVGKEGSIDVKLSTKSEVPGKKQTNKSPAKVSTKTQATGKGKSSKKPKAEPSREEINEVVVDILKKVDFNTATLSDILRQLGTHFDLDLIHRKAEVKDIITEAINNMSDDEEGEESEENADTGEGVDKDGNGNDDT
ncbi:DEK domain-containing chromatin-associated protein 1 isoform X1 [Gossypium raimondii]|uniref:DEK domain-containing chromatin-associated protein 1 isoform X1 n=1 Tax=Gossypium raimondii TaxID=29730 RepID=UPI00063AC0C8|nr:DEK domain-containing chromatin-associated protein 1 isoform X1 [Gossypium raimondii]